MKILHSCVWIMALASAAWVSADPGLSNYQPSRVTRQQYTFKAWPTGAAAPLYFKSVLYNIEGVSHVRIDEGKLFPAKDDSPVRKTADFDSLKAFILTPLHSVTTPEGTGYFRDTVWYPAFVVGPLWTFKKVTGRVSLYTLEPGHGAYRGMDTGAGVVVYSEEALRRKIAENPRAARLLRQEAIGHNVAWGMGFGGLGLLTVGAATALLTANSGSSLMFAGLGLAAFAWIPHLMVQDRFEAAIRAYNQGQ